MDGFIVAHALAEISIVSRNITPTEKRKPLLFGDARKIVLNGFAGCFIGRQKKNANAVLPLCREIDALRIHLPAQEGVGNLDENADAVAGFRVRTHRASMDEVGENLQTLFNNLVALAVLNIGDEAKTAGVVLESRVV